MFRQIEANGTAIAVVDTGPRDPFAVIFSNSLGTDLRVWDDVVALLPDLRVLRMDKRGHGLSAVEPSAATIEDHAEDLIAAARTLGVRRALVVGLSIGGLIAQTAAVRTPDLVAGLVLLDTAHRIGTDESWNARIAAVRDGGLEAIADAVMDRWFSAPFRNAEPGVVAAWRTLVARMPAAGYIAACEALRDADLTEVSRRIAVPTRVACGSADLATPPDLVREAASLIPGARFDIIDGAGHLPPVETPAAVAAMIRAAVGDVRP